MIGDLQIPAGEILDNAAQHDSGDKLDDRVLSEAAAKDQHDHTACAVDRKPRPVHGSAVGKLSGLDHMQGYFPEPSGNRKCYEQQEQG